MRKHIAALALLALGVPLAACQTSPTPASSAPQGTRWTAPSGTWSIDPVSQGWALAIGLPAELEYLAAVTAPARVPSAGEERACAVFEEAIGAGPDVAAIRGLAGQLSPTVVDDLFNPASFGLRVTSVSTFVLNRVTVADIMAISDDGTRMYLHRLFFLPQGGRAIAAQIGCFWHATLDPAKAAEIRAVLGTLVIR